MKGFYNACTVEVDSEGDHFSQHDLDLNREGKEQAAKTNVSS